MTPRPNPTPRRRAALGSSRAMDGFPRPGRVPWLWALVPVTLVAVLTATGCSQREDDTAPVDVAPDQVSRVFSTDSPWNVPIPDDPVLDDDSDDMVGALTEDGGRAYALLYEYGVPVYEVDGNTPAVPVQCTAPEWGPCPLEAQPVRVPAGATPSAGDDSAMVVIDRSDGRVYDFWQARPTSSGGWTATWGTWAPLSSSGIGGEVGRAAGGATGAGNNLLTGVVRTAEIEAGRIDHALAVVSDKSCPDVFRYPATKTDGHASEPPCIPQGARIQLDPDIDVAAIPGITEGERAVGEALQTYGAYLRDSSGTAMGIVFETPTNGSDPYPDVAGFPWDYWDMPHIPWQDLRVLNEWDGG